MPMDEYEVQEKMEELQRLQQQQEAMKLENSMLSEHLSRIVARKGSMQIHLESLEAEELERENAEKEAAAAAEAAAKRRRSTKRSFSVFQDVSAPGRLSVRFWTPLKATRSSPLRAPMSLEEKIEVADEEISTHNDQISRLRSDNERILDDLRAVFRQTKLSIRELISEKNCFQRDLMVLAEASPKGKLYTEDFLRFQDEKLRKKRNIREKLQERIDLLHMEIMEAEHQFSSKRDLKEILHIVDFEEQQIQGLQLKARIRDRTRELWKLKGTIKLAASELEKARLELEKRVEQGKHLRHSIAVKTPQIASSNAIIAVEAKQQRKLTQDIIKLIKEHDGPPRPRVIDYMRFRAKSGDLRKEMKLWTQKVEVVEQNHVRLKTQVKCILRQKDAILEAAAGPAQNQQNVIPLLTPVLA